MLAVFTGNSLVAAALDEARTPLQPCSMAYVLQADELSPNRTLAIDRLAESSRGVVVIDRAYAIDAAPWSIPELESMRNSLVGREILAYFSIGEAEDYRDYWQPDWSFADGRPAAATPRYIVAPNPDWPGNYKVRYWDRRWQKIVLGDLDRLLGQSFDGAYLDVVDAFQFYEHDPVADTWQAGRVNEATGRSYRADMVAWVRRLAGHARARDPGFRIVPQNGSPLLHEPGYLDLIDAIAVEDLFTLGDTAQDAYHTNSVLADLELAQAAGKGVMVVEYAKEAVLRKKAAREARARGFALTFADRELKTLGQAGTQAGGCGSD